jgi:hypothetical protein
MSASLMVLIPLVLLGIVTALCFVGCAQVLGLQPWQNPTYQSTVSADPNIVALWPLNDMPPSTTALSIPPSFSGNYIDPVTLNQAGIVSGDAPSTCAVFKGGRVEVGFSELLNQSEFTIEAWVKPAAAAGGQVSVVAASDHLASNTGFVLFANASNVWQVDVGTGSTFVQLPFILPIVADGSTVSYLAASFNATTRTLSLFVGVVGTDAAPQVTTKTLDPGVKFLSEFMPNVTPLFIGAGRPDTGAMNPFMGSIQDVAYYKTALDIVTIGNHFSVGSIGGG